jgi:hypothetical protein
MHPHIVDNRCNSINVNEEDDYNRNYSCFSAVASDSSSSVEYNSDSERIVTDSSLLASSNDDTIVPTLSNIGNTFRTRISNDTKGDQQHPNKILHTRSNSFSRVKTTISPPRSRNGGNNSTMSPIVLSSNKSSAMIRSQLFNRLGITSTKDQLQQQQHMPLNNRSYDSTISILAKDLTSKSYEELIKADNGKPDVFLLMKYKLQKQHLQSPQQQQQQHEIQLPNDQVVKGGNMKTVYPKYQSNESNIKDKTSTTSEVRFDLAVKVHTIPNRIEYSDRIRATLWTDPIEMQQNAARNTIEYAAEGWDWTQVADDSDMIIMNNGERIHPVHFIHQ